MNFWVYMLRCRDGSYYVGHSDNLEGRLWQHNEGIGCDWTMRRRPVELVWCAVLPTRDDAFAFERRIKGWSRAKKEALIAGDWNEISRLARSPKDRLAEVELSNTARPELVEGRPLTSSGRADSGDAPAEGAE